MAKIIPFNALRPTKNKASLIPSRPFYTYKKNLLAVKLKENPFTFLHVINPEFNADDRTKPNSAERFEKVKEKYNEFKDEINIGNIKFTVTAKIITFFTRCYNNTRFFSI